MTLITEIKEIENRVGLSKAKSDSFSWYKESRDDKDDFSVARLPQQKGYLEAGKIHIFKLHI